MVGFARQSASRTDTLRRRCYLRRPDSEWHFELHGDSARQRRSSADEVDVWNANRGVAGAAEDYSCFACRRNKRGGLLPGLNGYWRHAGLYVVGQVGQPAHGAHASQRNRHLVWYADCQRDLDLYRDRNRQRTSRADGIGNHLDCGCGESSQDHRIYTVLYCYGWRHVLASLAGEWRNQTLHVVDLVRPVAGGSLSVALDGDDLRHGHGERGVHLYRECPRQRQSGADAVGFHDGCRRCNSADDYGVYTVIHGYGWRSIFAVAAGEWWNHTLHLVDLVRSIAGGSFDLAIDRDNLRYGDYERDIYIYRERPRQRQSSADAIGVCDGCGGCNSADDCCVHAAHGHVEHRVCDEPAGNWRYAGVHMVDHFRKPASWTYVGGDNGCHLRYALGERLLELYCLCS